MADPEVKQGAQAPFCSLFSGDGAYEMRDGKPFFARIALLLPEEPTAAEIAAALEITGRLAFETLFVPLDPWTSWVGDEQAPRDICCVAIAASSLRLPEHLSEVVRATQDAQGGSFLAAGQSFVGVVATDRQQGPCYVVVGEDDTSLLRAVRRLAGSATAREVPSSKAPLDFLADCTGRQASGHSLHDLTALSGLYELLPDSQGLLLRGQLLVSSAERRSWRASLRILALLCQHSSAVQCPLTYVPEVDGPTERLLVCVEESDSTETLVQMQLCDNQLRITLSSQYDPVVDRVLREWFEPLPVRTVIPWRERLDDLTGPVPVRATRAWAHYRAYLGHTEAVLLTGGREGDGAHCDGCVYEWQDPGEVSDLQGLITETLRTLAAGALSPSDRAQPGLLELFTSVSAQTAETLRRFAEELVTQDGLAVQVAVRSAHKSGLHWLLSDVLPDLRTNSCIARVHLSARRFQADDAVDRPIRYLQEFYPADVLLAKALDIAEECITLGLRDEGPMFLVQAYDGAGVVQASFQFEGCSALRPYLPGGPSTRQVCVPQALVRLSQCGDVLMEKSVPTNAERLWMWYCATVLPALKVQGSMRTDGQKFDQLEIHVWQDYEDVVLTEQEHSSVGEALAEDLYFNTLELLRQYAVDTGDPGWSRPGAVLPYVHEQIGVSPSAKVFVRGLGKQEPDERASQPSLQDIRVTAASYSQAGWTLHLFGSVLSQEQRSSLARWLTTTKTPDADADAQGRADFAPHDLKAVAAFLQRLPHALVLEHSYEGIPIWLAECYEQLPGYTTVRAKQALWKPTLFINARHHANEVSSTPAALALLDDLRTDTCTLARVNVVVIPLQNVDGARVHETLCQEHPTWMHHAARYNACGEEFARDYFEVCSPYGESLTYARVFSRWCPDVVLDDHGIPSHEWVQPFAGFGSPPSFPVSYWIPQARMYTIWRRLREADPDRQTYQSQLEAHVASFIRQDAEVQSANDRMLACYKRFGHDLDPDYFPLTLTDGSLTFVHEVAASPAAHSPMARYPHLVTAEIVTETDDETVIGSSLTSRVHAHRLVHTALLCWLTASVQSLHLSQSALSDQESSILLLQRPRPLRQN